MRSLFESIDKAMEALRSLTPSSLSQDNLNRVQNSLANIDILALLDEYAKELPGKPGDDDEKEGYLKITQQKADRLNKKIAPFLEALEELKKMRNTLNLSALDPVIQASQNIIRPIHNFSASLQE